LVIVGNSFAFRNDARDDRNSRRRLGITTNNGNIVLQTTTSGDIVIDDIVNANTARSRLRLARQIGLSLPGKITETCCGVLVGAALQVSRPIRSTSVHLFQ
jgi:hypothetical protein